MNSLDGLGHVRYDVGPLRSVTCSAGHELSELRRLNALKSCDFVLISLSSSSVTVAIKDIAVFNNTQYVDNSDLDQMIKLHNNKMYHFAHKYNPFVQDNNSVMGLFRLEIEIIII